MFVDYTTGVLENIIPANVSTNSVNVVSTSSTLTRSASGSLLEVLQHASQ